MSFAKVKKEERLSAERTAAVLTDLMTALATALVQAAGRGGKVPVLEDAATATLVQAAVLVQVASSAGKAAAWNAGG